MIDLTPFIFSSRVTAEELHESFINTNNVNFTKFAEMLSEEDYECTPQEALKRQPFNYISDGKKYVSFMSRPRVHLDENGRLCDAVFYVQEEERGRGWRIGFQKYLAMLSRQINSAPGGDTLWPYGRYELREIDGNVGAKLVQDLWLFFALEDDSDLELRSHETFDLHQFNLNLKDFGLMLCNFKDNLHEEFGPWNGLIRVLNQLEDSKNPAVDKIAVGQTAHQIVAKYVAVRQHTFDRDRLSQDIQKFKELLKVLPQRNLGYRTSLDLRYPSSD